MSTLNDLKVAGNCFIAHLEATQDSTDHIFPICSCPNKLCSEGSFCLKLTSLFEHTLNQGANIKKAIGNK